MVRRNTGPIWANPFYKELMSLLAFVVMPIFLIVVGVLWYKNNLYEMIPKSSIKNIALKRHVPCLETTYEHPEEGCEAEYGMLSNLCAERNTVVNHSFNIKEMEKTYDIVINIANWLDKVDGFLYESTFPLINRIISRVTNENFDIKNIRDYNVFKIKVNGIQYILKRVDTTVDKEQLATLFATTVFQKVYLVFSSKSGALTKTKVKWILVEPLDMDHTNNAKYSYDDLKKLSLDVIRIADLLEARKYIYVKPLDIKHLGIKRDLVTNNVKTYKLMNFASVESGNPADNRIEFIMHPVLEIIEKMSNEFKNSFGPQSNIVRLVSYDKSYTIFVPRKDQNAIAMADFYFEIRGYCKIPPYFSLELRDHYFLTNAPGSPFVASNENEGYCEVPFSRDDLRKLQDANKDSALTQPMVVNPTINNEKQHQ